MLVLDAGAFVAVERGDRDVVALVKRERLAGRVPVTNGGVVAQVWRGGRGRQVLVARLLAGVEVAPIDDSLGRRAGMLLARTGSSGAVGAVDAAIVCLAADGDDILTSDAGDLRILAEVAEVHIELIPV
jgi:predicted nucleic acid-binding protein